MSDQSIENISGRIVRLMRESSQQRSQLHSTFLQQRANSLKHMQGLIALQLGEQGLESVPPAIFTSHQLDEFGAGKISNCFGPDFVLYDQLQIPRIPNGDLKMMSRVMYITGKRRDFSQPASIEVELDIPTNAWYLHDNVSNEIPYSILMEIALQPCGFLSAYLDTYALIQARSFYFRNLDGNARVLARADVRGKTLSTRADLLTSVASSGTVIQKYRFDVRCDGQSLYQGESTFGYFSAGTMASQVGLDAGLQTPTWLNSHPEAQIVSLDLRPWKSNVQDNNGLRLPGNRLGFLDQVSYVKGGGKYGKGYLKARRPVNAQDWFYPFHFYGDPVMPGSLGVEAMLECLKAYALAEKISNQLYSPSFSLPVGGPITSWRYRGQITPRHKEMELEVHVSALEHRNEEINLCGAANLWVDGLRIYEVKDVSVRIVGI